MFGFRRVGLPGSSLALSFSAANAICTRCEPVPKRALVVEASSAPSNRYSFVSEAQLDARLLQFKYEMQSMLGEIDRQDEKTARADNTKRGAASNEIIRVSRDGIITRERPSVAERTTPIAILEAMADRDVYQIPHSTCQGGGSRRATSQRNEADVESETEDLYAYDGALLELIRSQLTNSSYTAGAAKRSGAADALIGNTSKSSQPEGWSMWDELPDDDKMDTFDCNNKQCWVDQQSDWCHLCDEPVGGAFSIHIGDRDHMCLQLFLQLYSRYPLREVGPECSNLCDRASKVLSSASANPMLRSVYQYASMPYQHDHLHTYDDGKRRAELTAILIHLCHAPHQGITHVLQGQSETAFWHSGERMFRSQFSKMIAQLFPPMSAGVQTQLSHKCYGRTNLERLYDALQIADIQKMFGTTTQDCRDSKAQFMRLLMWNLLDTSLRRPAGDTCSPQDEWNYELTVQLASIARRRLVFEAIYLQSMQFMNKVQGIARRLGYPTYEELRHMNVL